MTKTLMISSTYRLRILQTLFALLSSCWTRVSDAQSCTDITVALKSDLNGTRASVVEAISRELHISVLAELLQTPGLSETVLIPKSVGTMADISQRLGDSGTVSCSVVEHVVHIYDGRVLEVRQNALSHRFIDFPVPANAEIFLSVFKNRVHREAYPVPGAIQGGPGADVTSQDAARYELKQERLENVTARDVFLYVGREQTMRLAISVPLYLTESPDKTWLTIESQMKLSLSR